MALPANIDLSSLNGVTGFKLNGDKYYSYSGSSVASAGDVNGDGFDDLIIGAEGTDQGYPFSPGANAGASYVVFGKASGFGATFDLATLNGSNGFKLSGVAEGDYAGGSVASAGDVNGDGFGDLIVSAKYADANGSNSGASYVVFGKAAGFAANIDLSSLNGSTGFKLSGAAADDQSGWSAASAGDVNGDGFDDLIIGARYADANGSNSGASYVVFGQASGFAANINLSTLNGSTGFKLSGAAAGEQSGFSVASAGDVNGDGFDDLIVGVRFAGMNSTGASFVVFGKASGFTENLNLSSLDGSNGFRLNGAAQFQQSGFSVASAGDVNGDGFADLIVGAPGFNATASYVVFGKASGFAANIDLSALNGSNGFKLSGAAANDASGTVVASAGDFNGDGFADLIVGAPRGQPHGYASGASYVVFGKATGFAANIDLASLDGSSGFKLSGTAAGDQSGSSVASAGDVNGDGYDDLIIGADRADPNGRSSGASYVMFGGAFGATVTTSGTAAAEMLIGSAGNDTLIGRGGADVFHAGAGNDHLVVGDVNFRLADGGNGYDKLSFGGTGMVLDLTNPVTAAKLEGIERIDITGTGSNTLIISSTAVLGGLGAVLGGKHVLTIERNAGDVVTLSDEPWVRAGSFSDASGTFDRYVLGNAEVQVEQVASPVGTTIVGTAGDDIISTTVTVPGQPLATGFSDIIDGGAGNDSLNGGAGNDILYGQDGDDTLIGGVTSGGTNQLWGGTGSDTASYVGTTGAVYADLAAQAGFVGGILVDQMNSIENLVGGSGSDVLVGDAGRNVLAGGAGNDVLYGQDGDDTLIGGGATAGGTNQLWGGTGNDTASYVGTTGAVYADLGAQAAYVDGVLVDQMNSIENLVGGSGNDVLVGDAVGNVLTGGAGADVLYGQGGDDILIGGSAPAGGTNQLWGGTGFDTASYVGTSGSVYADVSSLSAYIDGVLVDQMNSIENLIGGSGSNVLVGDAAGNVLTGGTNTDYLYGQDGNDTLIGGGAGGTGGANQLWGGAGSDTASYVGTTGAVYADLGAQSGHVDGVLVDLMNSIENLTGGSSADTLVGNGGANRLTGGAGGDVLWGKGGADVFVYNDYADSNLVTGYDIIADFISGTSKLDLTALGLDASHIVILSDAQSTSLYVEKTAGTFDVSTDLAISLVGANAITLGDILL